MAPAHWGHEANEYMAGIKGKKQPPGFMSEEHKRKISEAQKGRRLTDEHRAKLRGPRPHANPWNKGKPGYSIHTEQFKRALSARSRGNKNSLGKVPWNKGLKGFGAGPQHPRWKGGISPENDKIRHSFEYREWRDAVFARDNYTCVECGDDTGGNLEADHIKPFALFPDLRFDVNNGRTLCHDCHTKTPTYGRKAERYANH
jgi:HNH endonuclease/NUMOD3 motif